MFSEINLNVESNLMLNYTNIITYNINSYSPDPTRLWYGGCGANPAAKPLVTIVQGRCQSDDQSYPTATKHQKNSDSGTRKRSFDSSLKISSCQIYSFIVNKPIQPTLKGSS